MIQTIADALSARGYDALTPVQEAVTAPELDGADLLVSAQTGSGKTVAFGLAIAPTLLDGADRFGPAAAPAALVVAPTRELALQVMRELGWLYAGAGARVVSCIGGMDARDERRALERGAHVVVGTPGRLRDHIQRGALDLTQIRAVVLDEADEMLDLGFREDLEFMLAEAPRAKRTLLFSATVPPMIATLAKTYQRDAVRVNTAQSGTQHADIAYQALRVAQRDAENAVINVLRYHEDQVALVFANTRAAVTRLATRLSNRGLSVVTLSGELSQAERSHALQAMRDGRARICVATDVAARGIDLPKLELVIHAELPSNAEALLHRSGRTGRAGRKGVSALIVTPKAASKAARLLKFAKITAEWTTAPSAEDVLRRDEERLLSDPAWSEEPSDEQRSFAEKLLARHTPEQVAAAYLRLYRERHATPEDLTDPGAAPERKERAPFGPAGWIALSVGRDDRAEARWLLPLLCRAGGIDKDAIGAIRVQQKETFVELTEASLPGFFTMLGPDAQLENGVAVRRLSGPPDLAPRGPAQRKGRSPDADTPAPRPQRTEASPARGEPEPTPPRPRDKPRPRPGPVAAQMTESASPDRPRDAPKPAAAKPAVRGEKGPSPSQKPNRYAKPGGKPGGTPAGPGGKPTRQPGAAVPRGKPAEMGKRFDKPGGPGGKPASRPGGKPSAKPGPKPDAADTSKRMERPGWPAKPRGKPAGKPGGAKPPRRG